MWWRRTGSCCWRLRRQMGGTMLQLVQGWDLYQQKLAAVQKTSQDYATLAAKVMDMPAARIVWPCPRFGSAARTGGRGARAHGCQGGRVSLGLAQSFHRSALEHAAVDRYCRRCARRARPKSSAWWACSPVPSAASCWCCGRQPSRPGAPR